MSMFPRAFETSVYTVQPTICPLDMLNPPNYQYPSAAQHSFDNLNVAEEFGFFCSPPMQNYNVTSHSEPHPGEDANVKINQPLPRKRKQPQPEQPQPVQPQPVQPQLLQATDPEVPQQQLAAKRRRKTRASFFCTFPDCSSDFTSKHRLESHIKGCHLGIKDNICSDCSYATAHPSDLARHLRLKHRSETPDQR